MQNRFKALLDEMDTNISEPAKRQLYDHLMQSVEDIKNGDVCSMEEAIEEALNALDSISFEE